MVDIQEKMNSNIGLREFPGRIRKLIDIIQNKLNKTSTKNAICKIIIIVVGIIFSYIIGRFALNIPQGDDYNSILNLIPEIDKNGFGELFDQHNEHRIFLAKFLSFLHFLLFDEINFMNLIYIGNSFLLVIIILFYRIKKNIYLLSLLCLIILIPNFEMNIWAMATIQNIGVIALAFLSAIFFFRKGYLNLSIAIFFGLLATYTSGSGLLVFPSVLIIKLASFIMGGKQKASERGRLLIWLTFGSMSIYLYFCNYIQPAHHPSLKIALFQELPNTILYFCTLLGSFFKFVFHNKILPIIGFSCLLNMGYLFLKKWDILNKYLAVATLLVFVLLSSLALAVSRSGFGIGQSLSDRYFIISALILSLVLFFNFVSYRSWYNRNFYFLLFALGVSYGINTWESVNTISVSYQQLRNAHIAFLNGDISKLYFPSKDYAYSLLNNSIELGHYNPPIYNTRAFSNTEETGSKEVTEFSFDIVSIENNVLTLVGWAYMNTTHVDDENIFLIVKKGDQIFETELIKEKRPDVAQAKGNEDLLYSGFRDEVSFQEMPLFGELEIGIRIRDAELVSEPVLYNSLIRIPEYLKTPIVNQVNTDNTALISQSAWSVKLDNALSFRVEGWAFVDSARTKSDEQKYIMLSSYEKTYIFPVLSYYRPDVTSHFNTGKNFDYSGFDAFIYKSGLDIDKGIYKVGIYIKRLDGSVAYELSKSEIVL